MKAEKARKEAKRCTVCGRPLFSNIEKEFGLCPEHLHLASDSDTEPAKKVKAKPKKAKASKRSSTKKAKEEIK